MSHAMTFSEIKACFVAPIIHFIVMRMFHFVNLAIFPYQQPWQLCLVPCLSFRTVRRDIRYHSEPNSIIMNIHHY